MGRIHGRGAAPRRILVLACACAFFSIFSTFDSSEHYRAWKTAQGWTELQKSAAFAEDVDLMRPLSLAVLAANAGLIVVSLTCLAALAAAMTRESEKPFKTAQAFVWLLLALGLLYVVLVLVYRAELGPRRVLKGPVYDYDMRLSPPVILALCGYPLSFALYLRAFFKERPSKLG